MRETPQGEYRFSILLAALILMVLAAPFLELLKPGGLPRFAEIATAVLFIIVLLSAVNAVAARRATTIIAVALVGLIFGLWAVNNWMESTEIAIATHVLDTIFLGFVIAAMLRNLFAADRVTWNTIAASLCIYLLLAVVWAEAYAIVALADQTSFTMPSSVDDLAQVRRFGGQGSATALYYSLVTMSTLGYGDIVPVTRPARTFAALEAVTGQLYIAVLVARLVGLHIVHSRRV